MHPVVVGTAAALALAAAVPVSAAPLPAHADVTRVSAVPVIGSSTVVVPDSVAVPSSVVVPGSVTAITTRSASTMPTLTIPDEEPLKNLVIDFDGVRTQLQPTLKTVNSTSGCQIFSFDLTKQASDSQQPEVPAKGGNVSAPKLLSHLESVKVQVCPSAEITFRGAKLDTFPRVVTLNFPNGGRATAYLQPSYPQWVTGYACLQRSYLITEHVIGMLGPDGNSTVPNLQGKRITARSCPKSDVITLGIECGNAVPAGNETLTQ